MKQHHRAFAAIFSVTGLLIVSKLLGFVKQMITAAAFGATMETDLINLAQGLVGNIQYLLVQSVLSALIAVYLHTAQQGEEISRHFAFDVWKALSFLTTAIVLLVEFFAPWLARLIAPSYSAEQLTTLTGYLRLFAPVLLLLAWISVFNGLLHANQHFIPGEMISIHQSIVLIAMTTALARTLGIKVLIFSFFAYNIWNAGYTAILSRRYWTVSRGNPFQNPAVRKLLRMMGPLLLGYSLVYINQMVDKMLVSGLEAGTVTALNYAAVLSNLVSTFITTFASMLFTYVTVRIASGDTDGAARLTERTALLLLIAFLPISLLTMLQAEDIVTIIYAHGAFEARNVRICAQALRGYALMFAPLVLREVYSRFQYGNQDSKRPMINSSIGIVLNMILSVVLCPYYGVLGVTFATSISIVVCGVLNMHASRKLNALLSLRCYLRALPFLILGSVGCSVTARCCSNHLTGQNVLIRLMLTTLASLVAYMVCISPLLLHLWRQLKQEKT